MATTTTMIIIRHGETEWNLINKHQGQLDSKLTPNGIMQVEVASDTLTDVKCDLIYTSDLGRAIQTAEIIAERVRAPIVIESGLREAHLGILQGLTKAEFATQHSQEYQNYLARDVHYVIPGGESIQQTYDRSIDCLERIAANHPNQTVIVITHGGILSCLFRKIFQIPLDAKRCFSLKNAGINIFTICDGWWKLEVWGK